jgi:poly(hydroxyalkanoate) granule-associated protein
MVARRKKTRLESAVRKARNRGGQAQATVIEGVQQAERMIRDAFESAQGSVQSRLGSAREQASETWDNLEALFQSRVQKALQQIGMPNAEEVRLLTKRVAELNENVKALSAKPARRSAGKATAKAAGKKARRGTRRQGPRASG